jgi:hypothetical protein
MSMRILAVAFVVVAACTPSPKPPVPVTRDVLVGTWSHELPNHEAYELMLFDSGIAAFIHEGEKLPISKSFGRWSFEEGTLDLHMVGGGPTATEFPLSNRIIVMRDGSKLVFDVDGASTHWAPKDRYGIARDGAADRAATDENSWKTQVEAAEQSTRAPNEAE